MIWYEVIEDLGDGCNRTRRFRTYEEACEYEEKNLDYCYSGVDEVDTDSKRFFYKEDKCE